MARATFGERVATVDRVLGGALSRHEACRLHGIDEAELARWLGLHARDRIVALAELRPADPLAEAGRHLARLESLVSDHARELALLRAIARERGLA